MVLGSRDVEIEREMIVRNNTIWRYFGETRQDESWLGMFFVSSFFEDFFFEK